MSDHERYKKEYSTDGHVGEKNTVCQGGRQAACWIPDRVTHTLSLLSSQAGKCVQEMPAEGPQHGAHTTQVTFRL